jgi:RNA polymerase sigma-70 factor (ECF subfamily)
MPRTDLDGANLDGADSDGADADALDADAVDTDPDGPTASFAVPRDADWFDDLFRTHTTAVFRYFARRAPLDDADDLTADVFATAWRRRDVVPAGAELPWLYQTAGYILANHRRKGRPEPVADIPEDIDSDDPADLAVNDDELKLVLAQLSPRDRRILLLHAWEGLDGDELAVALGISRGGADAALSRARARLRSAWGDHGSPT